MITQFNPEPAPVVPNFIRALEAEFETWKEAIINPIQDPEMLARMANSLLANFQLFVPSRGETELDPYSPVMHDHAFHARESLPENVSLKLVVHSPSTAKGAFPVEETIISSLKEFRPFQHQYLLLAAISGPLFACRTCSGSHSETINTLQTSTSEVGYLGPPHWIIYSHAPSGYEKTNLEASPRMKFVEDALASIFSKCWLPKIVRTDVGSVLGIALAPNYQETLKDLLRLSHAVKNLDLVLSTDRVPAALELFKAGFSNIESALPWFRSDRSIRSNSDAILPLNETERSLLERFEEQTEDLKHASRTVKRLTTHLKSVSDLNFKVAYGLGNLDRIARLAVLCEYPDRVLAQRLRTEFMETFRNFEKLHKAVCKIQPFNFQLAGVDLSLLENRWRLGVEDLASVAHFGYGGGLAEDQGLIPLFGVPHYAANKFRVLQQCLGQSRKDLPSWESDFSFEEALRYLHQTALFSISHSTLPFSSLARAPLKPASTLLKGAHLFVLPKKEPSILKRIRSDLEAAGEQVHLASESSPNRESFAIFDQNYFSLYLPFGKHFAEMTGTSDPKRQTFTLFLRYIESSNFVGSFQRLRFITAVLSTHGFHCKGLTQEGSRPLLQATWRGSKKEEWEETASITISLLASSRGLDLTPDLPLNAAILFSLGIRNPHALGPANHVYEWLQSKRESLPPTVAHNFTWLIQSSAPNEQSFLEYCYRHPKGDSLRGLPNKA
jgi:hypothetical protein